MVKAAMQVAADAKKFFLSWATRVASLGFGRSPLLGAPDTRALLLGRIE
jgi:hypothetical protein